ncbi:Maf family nucleotide pyrophosphatase [Bacteroidota bacterium]
MLQNLEKYKIILASKSPRRHQLLKELGLDFEVFVFDSIPENFPNGLKNTEIPVFLAKQKANAYYDHINDNNLLITADTIVWQNENVIGKPKERDDAVKILKQLSGCFHQVITGVCIITKNKQSSFYSLTDVHFTELTDEEIYHYVDECKPYDKAGAYGIQELIGHIGVDRIDGSYFNVMGLPIQKLYSELKKY